MFSLRRDFEEERSSRRWGLNMLRSQKPVTARVFPDFCNVKLLKNFFLIKRLIISTGNHSGFFQVSSDTTLQGRRRKDNVLPKHAPQQGYYGSSPGLFQCVHRRSTSVTVRSSFKFTPLPEF